MMDSHLFSITFADFLKFPHHISNIQQVLLDQRKNCTAKSDSRTE